jgi:predicted flavoprotein YhiN
MSAPLIPADTAAPLTVALIGAGPAGLAAAEVLSAAGIAVHVFDAMPTVGRKFLLAGKGGLNLTHAEPLHIFATRYGTRQSVIQPLLAEFGPEALRTWAEGLGVPTFVGSSGRVFPVDMKSAPLLRAWLHRLRHPAPGGVPVQFRMRHRWVGWDEAGALRFDTPQGRISVQAHATLLALGGGSWSRLGSDGAWVAWLQAHGVDVVPLQPANCGFDVASPVLAPSAPRHADQEGAPSDRPSPAPVADPAADPAALGWTPHFASRFAGQPFKSVAIRCAGTNGQVFERKGEFIATATGVEGSLIYAAAALLREQITATGSATVELDLLPGLSAERVLAEVQHPRGSRSLSSHLKSRLGLDGIKAAILYELLPKAAFSRPEVLAAAIKALPIHLRAPRPLDEAISTAGGVPFTVLNEQLMLTQRPGVFCAGEMLDWEAPTGGYLLTACMATGRHAANGVRQWLHTQN